MIRKLSLPLALVVAAAFSASPAVAQKGHGNGHGEGHDRSERRGHNDEGGRSDRRNRDGNDNGDRYESRRGDYNGQYGNSDDQLRRDRMQRQRNRTSSRNRFERRVPQGWCIGRGNPHNTVANCGSGSNRYDRRYDPRYSGNSGYNNNGRYNTGTYGSNRGSYSEWKRWHDQQCRDLARQRPLDLRWQLQVRNQCSAEERQARARYGV
ncbi:MAG TPA: hypothetical protein VGO40_24030 [Longimicrobium sp.]|jgi:hypothetical protein|nr:hypothetical protein [Longimicrobium sp.]